MALKSKSSNENIIKSRVGEAGVDQNWPANSNTDGFEGMEYLHVQPKPCKGAIWKKFKLISFLCQEKELTVFIIVKEANGEQ